MESKEHSKMSASQSLKPLVCEEVFDERSQPSEEEVLEFAVRMGIDPDVEPHLIPVAREGLLKPLPKNWKPVYDPESKNYYYFNFKTAQTSWEHPLDSKFRDLVKKSRSESLSSAGEEDSKTSIKEELKSFEETAASIGLDSDGSICVKDNLLDYLPQKGQSILGHNFAASTPQVPTLKSALSPLRSTKKGDKGNPFLSKQKGKMMSGKNNLKPIFTPKPLFSQSSKDELKNSGTFPTKPTKPEWDEFSSYLSEESEHLLEHQNRGNSKYPTSHEGQSSSTVGRFTVNRIRKIDIDSQSRRLDTDGSDNVHRTPDRFSRSAHGQPELTLTGGGSMFLKSNQKKIETKNMDEVPKSKILNGIETDAMSFPLTNDCVSKTEDPLSLETPGSSYKSSFDSAPMAYTSLTRSILRTPQGEKRLWDIDPVHMSVSEKNLWKQQELEEEKKSVRFNLDKEINISFKLSGSSNSESELEVGESFDFLQVEHHNDDEDLESNTKSSNYEPLQMKHASSVNNESTKATLESSSSTSIKFKENESKETWIPEKQPCDLPIKGIREVSTSSIIDQGSPRRTQWDVGIKTAESQETVQGNLYHSSKDKLNVDSDQIFDEAVSNIKSNQESITLKPKPEPSRSLLEGDLKSSEGGDLSLEADTNTKSLSSNLVEHQSSNSERDNFMVQVKEKLEDVISRGFSVQEELTSREDRAREQALLDWNVKQNDGETHRPQLSRQQSQQQLQQIKQKMQDQTGAEDRKRALREWSVFDGSNDSATDAKATEVKSLPKKTNMVPSTDNHQLLNSSGNDQFNSDSYRAKFENIEQTNVKSLENFLSKRVDELKQDYEKRLKDKELEFKLKIEEDDKAMIQAYQEKLQKRLEEEAIKTEVKVKEMVARLERESEARVKQIREQLEHKQECATQMLQEQHQQALAAQEVENQAAMLRAREQLSAEIKAVREQFQREEEQFRKEHLDRISNLREDRDGKRSKETTDHLRVIEKLRCEKRLVEDKYRTLKEKYIKLKGEMKANLEKKEQKQKEVHQSDVKIPPKQMHSTVQEAWVSQTQPQSDRSSETESRPKVTSSGSSAASGVLGFQQVHSQTQPNLLLDPPPPAPDSGPSGVNNMRNNNNEGGRLPNASFLGMSFPDFSLQGNTFNANNHENTASQPLRSNNTNLRVNEKNGNIPSFAHENLKNHQQFNGESVNLSPLDALRHQLRTLDEIEDQLPATSVTDAYLRYPFTDPGKKDFGSSELEFFRHRIHLERDMIRQAKDSLQAEQSAYRSRLHEFQRLKSSSMASPSASSTLYEMAKEEQELSDIESKLQRTRRLLSEKIIHLRHLENSLYRLTGPDGQSASRVSKTNFYAELPRRTSERRWAEKVQGKPQRRWDWKVGGGLLGVEDLSDELSSDSGGSSGFSSTEHTSDGTLASLLSYSGSGRRFKQMSGNSTDINASLHNLNAEISEIWNVLCKQRAAVGLGPPPLLNSEVNNWADSPPPTSPKQANHVTSSPPIRASTVLMTPSVSKVAPEKNSSLIQRTNNLRQWLQKAKMSATLLNPANEKDQSGVSF